jgi:HAD superfamily hydrolase (TIGR01509 family)
MARAAIFDIDGTLIDSVDAHAQAWRDAFRDYGFEVDVAAIRAQIGKGGDQLMPVFLPQPDLAAFGEELEEHRAKILKERYLPNIQPFPEVRALFERLHEEGLRIVLASSAHGEELATYTSIAGIEGLADAAVSSEDVAASKPAPDIFRMALMRLAGIAPADVLVIGDTPYDAQAAARAGLQTIGVLSGGFAEADLRSAGCVAIYRDAADLLFHYADSPLAA